MNVQDFLVAGLLLKAAWMSSQSIAGQIKDE